MFAIFGRLGDGKTLALTYLTFEHWFKRREKIYSNYHLFKMPYYYLNGINQLNLPNGTKTESVFCALDEVWRLINARTPMAKINMIVYDILGRSRKKNVTFCLPIGEKVLTNPDIKSIDEINIGDKVLTDDGSFQTVTDKMERYYNGNLVGIKPCKLNVMTKLTEEHPILAVKRKFNYCPEMVEVIENHSKEKNVRLRDISIEIGNGKLAWHGNIKKLCELMGISLKKDYSAMTKKPYLLEYPDKLVDPFKPEWIPAKNLEKGDWIVYPIINEQEDIKTIKISDYYEIKIKSGMAKDKYKLIDGFWKYRKGKIKNVIDINNEFMELAGFYIAEGSAYKHMNICFGFGGNEMHLAERTKYLLKCVFNLESKIDIYDNHINVLIGNIIVGTFLRKLFGDYSHEKKMPQWFLKLPIEKQKSLIDSYSEGDGYYYEKSGGWFLCTVSEVLAYQLIQIFFRMGTMPCLHINRTQNKSFRPLYILSYYPKGNIRGFIHNNHVYYAIHEIKKIPFCGKVYNFEVENRNSYTTMSLCVHNCFTSQLKSSMDKNVVQVLDFISKPSLTPDNSLCRLDIFAGAKASSATLINSPRFWTEPFKMMFETQEQIDMENVIEGDPPLIFQPYYIEEHGFCCECEKCGTKFFKTWEEADEWSSQWWEKHWKEVLPDNLMQGEEE